MCKLMVISKVISLSLEPVIHPKASVSVQALHLLFAKGPWNASFFKGIEAIYIFISCMHKLSEMRLTHNSTENWKMYERFVLKKNISLYVA